MSIPEDPKLVLIVFIGVNNPCRLFEAAGALGIVAVTKAPRGSGGLPKQKCVLEVP